MIISKTPLRISFFGGGTDIPAFSDKEFGCVLSTSIDKYIYLVMHKAFGENNVLAYSKREDVKDVEDIKHTRIREIMKKTGVTSQIEIHSLAEVPAGTGLGSSSSFSVGLLNLLYNSKGEYVSKDVLAREACEIEIGVLKEPIGKQDQYAAAMGGVNFIKFNPDGSVEVEPIRAREDTLKKINDRLVIFYLDKTRDASEILHEQGSNLQGDNEKRGILGEMKKITIQMKDDLNNDNIENFGKMLHQSWILKKKLASRISDSEIDSIYERGLKAGATGGKVLGAGGGGFILFYCEPDKQDLLKEELKELRKFDVQFEKEGTKIIYSQ
ncbi:MAG: GHMP kinase [Nanoarchaeota archaeon]|nr:GHMP kinase [Nanoarchaeota archaeon]